MSSPLWNENEPGPSIPSEESGFEKTVRGWPKLARIGCCLWNGLTGQPYVASAGAAAASAKPRARVSSRRRRAIVCPVCDARTMNRLAPRAASPRDRPRVEREKTAVPDEVDADAI